MATALLQVRIDAEIKKQADVLFSKLARIWSFILY